MSAIFRKDRKNWTSAEQEQIQYFFRCNEFFSKFYEQYYFQDIVQLAYYAKIAPESFLYLSDNKRPSAIILLSGNIAIHKRQNLVPTKKHKISVSPTKTQQFVKVAECLRYNQTLIQSAQCKVYSLHGQQAEILFVPSFIYNKFLAKIKQDKDKVTFNILSKIFKKAENRYVMDLACSGCKIKQLKIKDYIYEQGEKPQSVYLIIDGSAKIQRRGFSHKIFQFVVVSSQSLLGDKDICYTQRQSSAICCSAYIRLLQIPKEPFLKFAKICLPELRFEQKQNSNSPTKNKKSDSPKKQQSQKLPLIMRFRSSRKTDEQKQHEYRLIKNSHVLLEASKPSKSKIRSRSSFSDYPMDLMQQKIKLFKKLRPVETKLDLSHRIF